MRRNIQRRRRRRRSPPSVRCERGPEPPSADQRVTDFVRRGSLIGQYLVATALVGIAAGGILASFFVPRLVAASVPLSLVLLNRAVAIYRHLEDPASTGTTLTSAIVHIALARRRA